MKTFRILAYFVIVILFVCIILLYLKISFFKVEKLSQKPRLEGRFIKNPDFVYKGRGWLSSSGWSYPFILLKRNETDWRGNGWHENMTIDGRDNVIVIHPIDTKNGRFIEQEVYLPKGKSYRLLIGIANIASKIFYAKETGCDDVGIKVVIIDKDSGEKTEVFNTIVNSLDGWMDLAVDLRNRFSGKKIIVRVESYAGGPCGNWRGEWGAVDYVDIVEY